MTTEAELWKKINEPKVKGLITIFDENGKPIQVIPILDRLPIIGENETVTYDSRWTDTQNRRKQK